RPRLLLVGIYFGNDFFDNWQMFIRNPSNYPVSDPLRNDALTRERQAPLSPDVMEFFILGQAEAGRGAESGSDSVRGFLGRNSALWGFARAFRTRFFPHNNILSGQFQTAVAALTPKQLEYSSIFDGGDWRTILTSRYREAVENLDDPRI